MVPSALSFAVLIGSIVVEQPALVFAEQRSPRRRAATRLAADALNFASDIVAATCALAGLIAVHYGHPEGDALAALGVASFIAIAGFSLGHRTINTLTDAAPPGLTERIKAITRAVPGVIAVDTLRLRPAGAEVLGDIEIAVPRTLPLERVATIKDDVRAAISRQYPEVSVTVAARPIALDNESVLERVLLIAAKRHVPIHHIIVQEIEAPHFGQVSMSRSTGPWRMARRNEIVSGLEIDVRKELGTDIEVDTHLEPLEPDELAGQQCRRRDPRRNRRGARQNAPPRPESFRTCTMSGCARPPPASSSIIIAVSIRTSASKEVL